MYGFDITHDWQVFFYVFNSHNYINLKRFLMRKKVLTRRFYNKM